MDKDKDNNDKAYEWWLHKKEHFAAKVAQSYVSSPCVFDHINSDGTKPYCNNRFNNAHFFESDLQSSDISSSENEDKGWPTPLYIDLDGTVVYNNNGEGSGVHHLLLHAL